MVLAAIRVQRRVMSALILRETKTRYGDCKLGYLWAVLEPVLFVTVFVGIFTLIGRTTVSGIPVAQFMLTGITPFLLFRKTMQQTNNAIEGNRALLAFPQITTFDLILRDGKLNFSDNLKQALKEEYRRQQYELDT